MYNPYYSLGIHASKYTDNLQTNLIFIDIKYFLYFSVA